MSSIVLAFSGGLHSSSAIPWLRETRAADVVTVTVDVGQDETLGALRGLALAGGAIRAHAIDAREELAREYLFPSLGGPPLGVDRYPFIDRLAVPLIARKLVDMARIEGTRTVAHGGSRVELDEAIRVLDPSIDVVAPARVWVMSPGDLAGYARRHGVRADPQASAGRTDQTLWGRRVSWLDGDRPRPVVPSARPGDAARLEIAFERGVPVALNGVPMSPVELVESVTLIAGRHGVGRLEADGADGHIVYDAPAAVVLHAARTAVEGAGVAHVTLIDGRYDVLASQDPQVVNHA